MRSSVFRDRNRIMKKPFRIAMTLQNPRCPWARGLIKTNQSPSLSFWASRRKTARHQWTRFCISVRPAEKFGRYTLATCAASVTTSAAVWRKLQSASTQGYARTTRRVYAVSATCASTTSSGRAWRSATKSSVQSTKSCPGYRLRTRRSNNERTAAGTAALPKLA